MTAEPSRGQSAFLGRQSQLARLGALHTQGQRLICITGPAGMGKTRLVSHWMAHHRPGRWRRFAPLLQAIDDEEVLAAVAAAVGVPMGPAESEATGVKILGQALATRGPGVLIIDNAEHVVAGVRRLVPQLLNASPALQVVVTSREPLGLAGEAVLPLPPLDPPQAVALLMERGGLPPEGLGPAQRQAADAIVTLLDCIPLAVELASGRLGILKVEELRRRLDQGLGPLYDRRGERPAHHRTLDAAIRWSWNLLTPWERSALIQLSVFRGGFTLEAAEAVVDLSPVSSEATVLEALESLQRRSLIHRLPQSWEKGPAQPNAPSRFDLYAGVTHFLSHEGAGSPEVASATLRHVLWALSLEPGLKTRHPVPLGPSPQVPSEAANLRAVVRRLQKTQPAVALEALLVLAPLLEVQGPLRELTHLLETTLPRADAEPGLLAQGWLTLGRGRRLLNQTTEAHDALSHAANLARSCGDKRLEGWALLGLDALPSRYRSTQSDERPFEGARALLASAGDERGVASCERGLALWYRARKLPVQSRRCLENARAGYQRQGDVRGEIFCLGNLVHHHTREGDVDRADAIGAEAVALCRRQSDSRLEGMILTSVGLLMVNVGRLPEAAQRLTRALDLLRPLGRVQHTLAAQVGLARVWMEEGRFTEADEALFEARDIALTAGAPDAAARQLGFVGVSKLMAGRHGAACMHLEQAAAELGKTGQAHALGLFGTFWSLSLTDAGDTATAQRIWGEVEANLKGNDSFEAVRLHALVGEVIGQAGAGNASASQAALSPADQQRSQAVRLAAQVVRRYRERGFAPAAASAPPTLTIGAGCCSLTINNETTVDISRRQAPRRILQQLIEARVNRPGEGIDAHRLFAVGWPDQHIAPDSALQRVYVALSTLRRWGLKPWLKHGDGGYLIDPELRIIYQSPRGP